MNKDGRINNLKKEQVKGKPFKGNQYISRADANSISGNNNKNDKK